MKKGLFVLALAALAVGAFYVWKQRFAGASKADGAALKTSAVIEQRSIRFFVTAAGDIGPADQVSVRPEVNGRIATLAVDIGDLVKQSAVLFTLDDRDLQIERDSVEKDIERAQLQLDQAERNFRRAEELFGGKLLSQELHEQTKMEYDLARNALARSQKTLELVNDKLRKTQILAPFDCTVLTRPVSTGQAVSGSGGVSGGTEVLTIANLTDLVINAHINQADVSRILMDQIVEVSVEAVAGLVLTGRVERVAPQATIKNGIKGFATRVLLKDVGSRARPGMTANIKVPVASAENVVAAPLAAVFTELNPETMLQERFVVVLKDGRFERRPVQIGIADNFFVEVTSGLAVAETVALELPSDELSRLVSPTVQSTNQIAAGPRPVGAKVVPAPAGATNRPASSGARAHP